MSLFKRLAGKQEKASKTPDVEEAEPAPETEYRRPGGGSGESRQSDGPFPSEYHRDEVLVKCVLAGYPDSRTRNIYQREVDYKLKLTGAPPLTNEGESVYHAYQRAQTRRAQAYKDFLLDAAPFTHRIRTDRENIALLKPELETGYPTLESEIEQWRYAWEDVAQILLSDVQQESSARNFKEAEQMDKQLKQLRAALDENSNEGLDSEVKEQLLNKVRVDRSTERFEAGAVERRGRIAENRGARRDAGYKNPEDVITIAERQREQKARSEAASVTNPENTSIKDFASS